MEENPESFFDNFLKGESLLQNKGIRYEAWDEYEKSLKVLPKTGKKFFEPNGSWLQEKQVEKGLQHRKDLLVIERVERKSQLAIAEWLPSEKRVRVLKKFGPEWSNFGTEINSTLYLMPEEALLMLEMNNIELLWEGVAVSLQQAYSILLDSENSECSLKEYRVYSQFARRGYRLQRCQNENTSMKNRTNTRESVHPRKKIIISPLNGLRMLNESSQKKDDFETSEKNKCCSNMIHDLERNSSKDKNDENHKNKNYTIEENVKIVMENIISNLESKEFEMKSENIENSQSQTEKNENQTGKKRNFIPKIEIISEETILNSVRLVKDTITENNTESSNFKRSGTRIKRNVKLLPKRIDKPSNSTTLPEVSQITAIENKNELKMKRMALMPTPDCSLSKKQKQEVIELSDDEVEEIQAPMTRIEILNQFPNIASKSLRIEQRMLNGFIPSNIKLQNNVYYYDQPKWQSMKRTDNCDRVPSKSTNNRQYPEQKQNNNQNRPFAYANPNQSVYPRQNSIYEQMTRMQTFQSNNMSNLQYLQWCNRNRFLQQNSQFRFQHNGKNQWLQNRYMQSNIYNNTLLGLMGNIMKSYLMRNQFQHNYRPNSQSVPSLHDWQNSNTERAYRSNFTRQSNRSYVSNEPSNKRSDFNMSDHTPSFVKVIGPSTWKELKKKWQEESTITIDDEDIQEGETGECNETVLIEQEIEPLITIKKNTRLTDVNDKLKLIKGSAETLRQKEVENKISYNIYSNHQHYKKTNPGPPMCRLMIIREDEDRCLDSIQMRQLPLDEKYAPLVIAYVCKTSISYIQPGFVSIPDLI